MILATTLERVSLPLDICARLEGRSSIGRMGLFIHNAGFIDPGFDGQITLELVNTGNSSIQLETGRRICQIVFEELKNPSERGYRGKYQHQNGATGSRIYLDNEAVQRLKHENYVRLADENVDEGEMEDVSTGAGLEEREEVID
jgi:dCTP deaminase